jgi:hypothetical protein
MLPQQRLTGGFKNGSRIHALLLTKLGTIYNETRAATHTHSLIHVYVLQISGNKPSGWGHLFLNGALESMEYYSADFSGNMPCGALRVVIAEPSHGCSKLTNTDEELKDR